MMRLSSSALLLCALVAGCSDATGPDESGIRSKIRSVRSANGALAVYNEGLPAAPQGGLPPSAPSTISAINGGTSVIGLTSAANFSRAAIYIDGLSGYYELTMPTAANSVQLLVTLAQTVEEGTLPVIVATADANGAYSARRTLTAFVKKVAAGDVQISLSWTGASDVDLHVLGPDNSEMYHGNRSSASGGLLDLTSNTGCTIDNVNNENVSWPNGPAPAGIYRVRVDYWSSCGLPSTNYVVTVNVAGRETQIVQGTLTGTGSRGGAGAGSEILTFTK
ncbi:MAG: hypothetical protein V4617_01445 [Gemmatimonadota bacterium]